MGRPRSKEKIRESLLKKGFREKHAKKGADHVYLHLFAGENPTAIYTKLSHGAKIAEYGDSLLGLMSRQLKLSKPQLLDLIDCPMDREQYLKTLVGTGHIPKL